MTRIKKTLALAASTLVVAGAAIVLPVATAAPAQAINTCHTVVVQKKLPWYQCINLRPGTLLPAACYGDVTKVVCSR